jgi:hypothetical protein
MSGERVQLEMPASRAGAFRAVDCGERVPRPGFGRLPSGALGPLRVPLCVSSHARGRPFLSMLAEAVKAQGTEQNRAPGAVTILKKEGGTGPPHSAQSATACGVRAVVAVLRRGPVVVSIGRAVLFILTPKGYHGLVYPVKGKMRFILARSLRVGVRLCTIRGRARRPRQYCIRKGRLPRGTNGGERGTKNKGGNGARVQAHGVDRHGEARSGYSPSRESGRGGLVGARRMAAVFEARGDLSAPLPASGMPHHIRRRG